MHAIRARSIKYEDIDVLVPRAWRQDPHAAVRLMRAIVGKEAHHHYELQYYNAFGIDQAAKFEVAALVFYGIWVYGYDHIFAWVAGLPPLQIFDSWASGPDRNEALGAITCELSVVKKPWTSIPQQLDMHPGPRVLPQWLLERHAIYPPYCKIVQWCGVGVSDMELRRLHVSATYSKAVWWLARDYGRPAKYADAFINALPKSAAEWSRELRHDVKTHWEQTFSDTDARTDPEDRKALRGKLRQWAVASGFVRRAALASLKI